MEDIYKGLDEVKAEMKKLKADYRFKTELSESLKRAHNELLHKYQEAKKQIEKQAQKLNAKSEEISEARKIHEDFTSVSHQKKISHRHSRSMNEKLRGDCGQKWQQLEGDIRVWVLALNEVMARNKELELNVCERYKEIEGLKRLLLVSERKCFEAEQKAQKAIELRQRDDMILTLDKTDGDVQNQLKWKSEQFKHLEEAYKGFRDQLLLSKEEWEKGKPALLEDISSLQTSLDSRTRILEGLQTRLETCNQVSDFKSSFDDVFAQCEEEKSKIQNLTVQRDEEIARVINSLERKGTLAKEIELRIVHLEQENQVLGESLKELREAQIRNAGATSSLTTLLNKLIGLEQVHSNFSNNLKAKESEWIFLMENMRTYVDSCKFELKDNEKRIQELQMDLENCHSTIKVLSKEIFMLCMTLKSEISEAYSKMLYAKAEMELHDKEKEDKFSFLIEKLILNKSYLDLGPENKELASLGVDSLECMQVSKNNEVQRYKKMLEESSECQLQLKKQVLQMESALENEKRGAFEALEKANLELAIHEASLLENELQNWTSDAESPKVCLDENQETYKQLETSLIAQAKLEQMLKNEKESLICIAKEQEKRIEGLQRHIFSLGAKIAAKTEELEASIKDKDSILLVTEEKEICIENLQKDITFLKQESKRREAEAAVLGRQAAEKAFEEKKERHLQIMNEKDQIIKDLQILAISLQQDLESAVISCFPELIEKHVQIVVLGEAIKNTEYLTKLEIEEKNKIIANLEKETCNLRQKLANEEEYLLCSRREEEQLQALLETNKLEIEKLMAEKRSMEGLVKELKFEKGILLQDSMKLSIEREDLLVHIQEICDRIGEFSFEDVKLMKNLGRILENSVEETVGETDLMEDGELYDSTRENTDTCFLAKQRNLKQVVMKDCH
ncbi:uncharacterized protein At4g38062-like [Quercus lobata]|uniref:Uncharacterized protein n=1 Tax=Quercus lobata TaxID=97700 RepID=A0A7N2RD94_QUELO|nr:uncharacterized protein At4g38062-like [Quercus lobata]